MLRHQFLVLTSVHINEYINFVLRKIFSRYNQQEIISMNIFQTFVKKSQFDNFIRCFNFVFTSHYRYVDVLNIFVKVLKFIAST